MKERPIIFTAEMVRAILEGRKTVIIESDADELDFTTELKKEEDGLWYWILKKKAR